MYDLRDSSYVPPHLRAQGDGAGGAAGGAAGGGGTGGGAVAPTWARERGARGPGEVHPWRQTPVGGTFKIGPGPNQPKYASVKAYCSTKGKLLGAKFRCHQLADGSIEVWRER